MRNFFTIICLFAVFSSTFASDYYYYFGKQVELEKRNDRVALVVNTGVYAKEYLDRQIQTLVFSGDTIKSTENFYVISFSPDKFQTRIRSYIDIFSRRPDIIKFSAYTYYGESRKVTQAVTDEFIVRLRNFKDRVELDKLNALYNVRVIGPISDSKGFLLKTNDGVSKNALELSEIYYNTGYFEYAEPNFLIPAIGFFHWTPNDPMYSVQWTLNNTGQSITTAGYTSYGDVTSNNGIPNADMDVDKAWDIVRGNYSVIIGVFDTGVDSIHPDLAPNLITGYNAYANTNTVATDPGSHGTCTLGLIGARSNNGVGVAGICGGDNTASSNCKMMSFRLVDNAGNFTTSVNIARAFDTARVRGIHVSSNSWGGGTVNTTLTNAINNCANNGRSGSGTVILFSSGNDAKNPPAYPSYLSTVICVGASSANDQSKYSGSGNQFWWGGNYGESTNGDLECVAPTICPTTDISGTGGYATGDYESNFNGTSCSCPNAAGVAGLIFSVNPNFTSTQVKEYLLRGCDKIDNVSYNYSKTYGKWNSYYGYGRVNAYNSVQLAMGVDVTPPTIVHNNVNSDSSTYPTKIYTIIRDQSGSGVPTTGSSQPRILYRWNRNGAGWSNFDSAYATTISGDSSFMFQIPCVGRQTEIQYYIRAYDNSANTTTFPRNASTSYSYTLCYFAVGYLTNVSNKLSAWTAGDNAYTISSTFAFSSYTILNTWIKINLRHTYLADEEMLYLWSPISDANNNRKQLIGTSFITGVTTGITSATVTDSASKFWKDGTQPFSNGYYKGECNFRGYNGTNSNGNWRFVNLDAYAGDIPYFDSLRVTFLTMTGTVSACARLDYEADSVCNFGDVFYGNTYQKDFYLKNTGNTTLTIGATSFSGLYPGYFTLLSSPSSINTGDSGLFSIQMSLPGSANKVGGNTLPDNLENAVLNIETNDPSKTTFRVSLQSNSPTPVELISFSSSVNRRDVNLSWATSWEINNYGFDIERAKTGNTGTDFIKIGFAKGIGRQGEITRYSYSDMKVQPGIYKYRLKQVDLNGNFRYYNLNGEVDVTAPKSFSLYQNYPNPFNPVTKIDFDIPSDINVVLKVYDITGREIKTLVNEKKSAGYYTVEFSSGSFASGVYFYRLEAGEFTAVKKMLLIK
ncbi:MAG: S8 family serine peptidase [Ignavibacteriae bacterium]|nr:S8 family serine peptidase [Ignavibacteriota bacterium]